MTDVLFTGVRVIDGSGAEPFDGQVLVRGNRIRKVARAGEALAEAAGAEAVEGGGATLMPGLIEAHAHISFCNTPDLESLGDVPPEEHTLQSMKYAKVMLDQGFTALFSAAAAKARLDVVIRNAIDAGEIPGPRMRAASPELTPTSGLGDVRRWHMHRETFAIPCDGPDEFRKMARVMVREGVDTLKINPAGDEFIPFARAHETIMNEAEVAAVCEVGRSRGKNVAAHARSAESVKMCCRQGVRVVYHATLSDEEALDMLEARKDEVFVAPTAGMAYVTAIGEGRGYGIDENHPVARFFAAELEKGVENMKALKRRGVRVLPGGDYGFAWNPIGTNARDLEHFVKLMDWTPMEAIVAATKFGGELFGAEIGLVKDGWLADLLLVDGDPSKDVSILQDRDRLLAIMKDGQFHKRPAARRAQWAAAE
ncbi:Imidazolonepropionase [Tistlia consotensis]|uniref:Imidazolonepropionase n=1 Tax=Tistlia consotensis USBA 355 TaxID=560819 RepID=A0A1Y6CHA1_9PROT|nr:amidohydrolase family protein [Tistlia consotensis]SMF55150.1 Imidazolonepropionase [Tistlia consotensis USBA 355]SNR87757.1 Imidazolonepropionase [Tistlia consotensis]